MKAMKRQVRTRERGRSGDALDGAASGLAATVAMTAAMFGAQRAGLLGEIPPKTISRAALRAANADATRAELDLWTTVSHLAFGTACGVCFGLAASGRARRLPLVLAGVAYGTCVWAVSYAGWIPALRILPRPTEDRPDRPIVMAVAHWVFGATLGALLPAASAVPREGARPRDAVQPSPSPDGRASAASSASMPAGFVR